MNLRILKRRAEMLNLVSQGLHPCEVVAQLTDKYGVTEHCLWSDWQRRKKWVPILMKLEKYAGFTDLMVQKLNAVEKAAWHIYLEASNDCAKVGALRTILASLGIHQDIVQTKEFLERLDTVEEKVQKY